MNAYLKNKNYNYKLNKISEKFKNLKINISVLFKYSFASSITYYTHNIFILILLINVVQYIISLHENKLILNTIITLLISFQS